MNRSRRIRSYFAGRVVWITGASSGIGRALAVECAKAGARLIISSRRTAVLDELSLDIRDLPERPEVAVLPLDVADHASISEKTTEAAGVYGRIDILINNAGVSHRTLVKDLTYEVVDRVIKTDLLGVIDLTLAVLKHLQGSGHIVVTSSIMGKFSTPYRSAYCAAKSGLHGFFSALFAETKADDIAVTLLVPGRVNTNIAKNALNERGVPQGFTDSGIAGGMEATKAAPLILEAIAKRKYEYYFGLTPLMRLGLFLNKAAPRLYRILLSRVKVR